MRGPRSSSCQILEVEMTTEARSSLKRIDTDRPADLGSVDRTTNALKGAIGNHLDRRTDGK